MTTEEKLRKVKRLMMAPIPLNQFVRPYAFTTENIAGYIDLLPLEDKRLLTVGSSCDQAINAVKKGCKDITILDTCSFTKEFFYLKKAALLSFDVDEFLNFFAWDPSRYYVEKEYGFTKSGFNKLAKELEEDEESYLFWKTLFANAPGKKIREKLFSSEEIQMDVVPEINPYLRSNSSYQETKKKIKSINPTFINDDIRNASLDKEYDSIILSNLFDYFSQIQGYQVAYRMINRLKEDGRILLFYLYNISNQENPYSKKDLYDKNRILEILPEESMIYSFPGMVGYDEKKDICDGAVIYQKKRH